jgi:hypothetical protein
MINNVREDLIPYLLTANHCLGGDATWIIMFNYESPNCSNIDGPTNQTVSGTTRKANNSASDFALLRLSTTPPTSYEVHYAGWTRSSFAATSSVGIHHPSLDIKKISFENNTAISTNYPWDPYDPQNSHWKVIWNDGTTEGGSSGSPLFDPNHRIVGQLHGGTAECAKPNDPDYYGKFSMSWSYGSSSSTRLRDWIDPDNTNPYSLSGMDDPRPHPPTNLYISGYQGGMPRINWTASTSPDIDHYELWCIEIVGPPFGWQLLSTTSGTWWVDSRVTIDLYGPEDTYGYKALAVDDDGGKSDFSNSDYVNVDESPPWGIPAGPDNMEIAIPETYSLGPNFPNPFNPTTTIRYDLPEDSFTELRIYDCLIIPFLQGCMCTKFLPDH